MAMEFIPGPNLMVRSIVGAAATTPPAATFSTYLNILAYGGVGDGTTANDTAFANAYAALSSGGGAIYFPAGKYLFNSAISLALPNAQFSIMFIGDGANATTLYWPNASGGIGLTAQHTRNTFHIRDMTLSTSQVNSGIAINLNGVGSNNGQFFQSDIQNVNICGDDIGPSASTEYWFIGILIVNWGAIDVSNVNTYGPHESPGAAGGGVGLYYEGNLALTSYATILNISRSSFNYHVYGLAFGDYWQGVTVDQCNFNGETGTAAINIVGTGGTLVLLTITNSQFNYGGTYQISVSVPFENLTLIGNTISIYNNGSVGVLLGVNVLNSIIIGNEFNVAGGATGTFGIACNGTNGVIQGNVFQDCTTPVDLQGSSSNIGVNLNRYFSTGANLDTGTGNQLGVISQ